VTIAVVGLGAGGHAKVVIELLRLNGGYKIVGLLDRKPELVGLTVLDVPILGDDTLLEELVSRQIQHFFVGLGSTGNIAPRRGLYELARSKGMAPVDAIHPSAIISSSAILGQGVTIAANAVINACTVIGENVIVNTGAIIEHDCMLGNHVHVATGARLASTVVVGEGAHIGAGATIRQCIKIGQGAIVGAGAVVVRDVPPHITVVGVPALPMKQRLPQDEVRKHGEQF